MKDEAHDSEWFERVLQADQDKGISYEELKGRIEELAALYDKTISRVNSATVKAWSDYAEVARMKARRMMNEYGVAAEYVHGQPYETPESMFSDIDKGILQISLENNTHPILTSQENLICRIWHDLTHYKLRSNFGFLGEWETCEDQTKQAPELAHVLHCDIVLQVAWGLVHKQFPPQKVFI